MLSCLWLVLTIYNALWVLLLHLLAVMVYDCNQLNFHKLKLTAKLLSMGPEQTCIRWDGSCILKKKKKMDACNAYFVIIFACFSCFLESLLFQLLFIGILISLFKTVPIKHTGLNNCHSFVIYIPIFIRVLEGFF